MSAIDEPLAIGAERRVKMYLGGVLPKPRGEHMLGFLDRHTVNMVDLLTNGVVAPAVRLACKGKVIARKVQALGDHQIFGRDHTRKLRHMCLGSRCIQIAFAHHDPAHIAEHRLFHLVETCGPHPDNPCLAIAVLLEANDFRHSAQRITGIHRQKPAPLGIAQIGHRIQRNIRNSLAKDHMERRQVIDRGAFQTALSRKDIGRIERVARRIERMIQSALALAHGARHGMLNHLAEGVVFKKAACVGL